MMNPTVRLRNGVEIPRLGLGVWKTNPSETATVVKTALSLGYRHIDTAQIYGNETEVGQALGESGLKRETLFVTTKLWVDDHGAATAEKTFETSLKKLGTGYIDLYLSHFPVTGKRVDTWKALQAVVSDGRCRALGVSNYTVRHLEELIKLTGIKPMINQVEFHPFLFQKELLTYCKTNGIVLEAYSPLVHGQRHNHPVLAAVAHANAKTVAQVLVRWCLQHGLVVIPKTTRKERMVENFNVMNFELSESDMAKLDALDEGFRTCWDPSRTP